MSTRWCASSATTWTPLSAAFAKSLLPKPRPPTRRPSTSNLCIDLSPRDHLLRFVIEGHLLAGLDGSNVHAKRDGVAVTSFNAGIGCLSGANRLHPIAHIGRGLRIALRVGGRRNRFSLLAKRKAGQQVRLHLHFARALPRQPTPRPPASLAPPIHPHFALIHAHLPPT